MGYDGSIAYLNRTRVLVTGGAGFIGSHLVDHLLERSEVHVRVLDDFSTGRMENVRHHLGNPNFELIHGDICDLDTCRDAIFDRDLIFHLAALGSVQRSIEDPIRSHQVNTVGFLNMLVSAKDLAPDSRFVYASSSSVYGDSDLLPKVEGEEGRLKSPYAVTKFIDELYARVWSDLYGYHTIGLRFFNVFGARQRPDSVYAAVIPKFCEAFLLGEQPVIYGDGGISRDFTHVDNAVHACMLAARVEDLVGHEAINIACGSQLSLNAIVALLNGITGAGLQPRYSLPRPGDIRHSLADMSRAARLLGYDVVTSAESGLSKTYGWYREQSGGLDTSGRTE